MSIKPLNSKTEMDRKRDRDQNSDLKKNTNTTQFWHFFIAYIIELVCKKKNPWKIAGWRQGQDKKSSANNCIIFIISLLFGWKCLKNFLILFTNNKFNEGKHYHKHVFTNSLFLHSFIELLSSTSTSTLCLLPLHSNNWHSPNSTLTQP